MRNEEALDHGAAEEGAGCEGSLPGEDVEPAGEVTEEVSGRGRREHVDPVILAAGGGGQRGEFRDGDVGGEAAGPDEEKAVDEACGATVGEAGGEEDEDAFPGCEYGGAEGEHGHEAEGVFEDLFHTEAG